MSAIPPYQNWQPALGADGVVVGLADIDQALHIILSTPKGSDPHRPEFASDIWVYLDRPMPQAITHIVREAVEAIRLWEPRISLVAVAPVSDAEHLTLVVTWAVADGVLHQTEVGIK